MIIALALNSKSNNCSFNHRRRFHFIQVLLDLRLLNDFCSLVSDDTKKLGTRRGGGTNDVSAIRVRLSY